MRVCDYIANKVYDEGVKEVFIVTGGGLMYLTDGIASHPQLKGIPCHHEQAAAMATVGYAKYKGFGCGFFTTGCGGTNAITGVLHAYQDSTPCAFFSGQCATNEIIRSAPAPLRQFGMQEADIEKIVEPITKYAVTIMRVEDVVYEVEKAFYLAKEGRPGPVWIDVPVDIQSAELVMENQRHFEQPTKAYISKEEISEVVEELRKAKRPLVIAGHGIRLGNAIEEFKAFIESNTIPFVYTKLGIDVYPNDKPLSVGGIGIRGTRAGNFAVQNADFILVLGSRLGICATGYNHELFAREAKIYVVDVDRNEHLKNTIKIDCVIEADVKDFLSKMPEVKQACFTKWAEQCYEWKQKYEVCLPEFYDDENGLSMYAFTNELTKRFKPDAAIVTDAGSTCYVVPQVIKFKHDQQRYLGSGAQGEMGYTLPGAIGVCFAKGKTETIGIVGDGSLQMNIQELQTMRYQNLPIKLFVWNNDGYLSIRGAQKNRFKGRYLGSSRESGVTMPDLKKICYAYDIPYIRLEKTSQYEEVLSHVLEHEGPIICEVMCRYEEWILCTWSQKTLEDGTVIKMPIEDMVPFLDREEFYSNMYVKPIS